MLRYFSTPGGRLLTGIALVLVGVFDLLAGAASDRVGLGLAALGAAYGLSALLGRRSGRIT